MPKRAPKPAPATDPMLKGFRIDRAARLGRHALLEVFPGLDRLATAARQVPEAGERRRLHEATRVEIVDGDVWMYVAPHKVPRSARREWRPIESPDVDCIVIGEEHLRESPALTVFLDIFHELCHVLQRKAGRELFPEGLSYVDRTTEVDAYRFVVDEARRLKVGDDVLREYLRVEWIDEEEFGRLLDAVRVSRAR